MTENLCQCGAELPPQKTNKRVWCDECRDKRDQKSKDRYKAQKKSGKCKCGKPLDPKSGRCADCRKAYMRAYYHAHKEKAKEYQREYTQRIRRHAFTASTKKHSKVAKQTWLPPQVVFSVSNLQNMTTEKFGQTVGRILAGQNFLTI